MAQPLESTFHEPAPSSAILSPGLHAGHVELVSDTTVCVRTLDGRRLTCRLTDGVERALIEQCMSSNQLVILAAAGDHALILGALQTHRAFRPDAEGNLVIEGKRVQLHAEQELELKTGDSALKLNRNGKLRVNGHRLVLDVTTNVRVLSALVELP